MHKASIPHRTRSARCSPIRASSYNQKPELPCMVFGKNSAGIARTSSRPNASRMRQNFLAKGMCPQPRLEPVVAGTEDAAALMDGCPRHFAQDASQPDVSLGG